MNARLAILFSLALLGPAGCTAENPAQDTDTDGGADRDLAGTDGPASTACGDIRQEVQRVLDAHRACKVDDDCTIAQTACGLPAACDTDGVYVSTDWRTAELEGLLKSWADGMCGLKECPCPKRLVVPPACNRGVCGPKTAGTAAVGAPCKLDGDCQTGQCLTETQDMRFAGGYCTIKSCNRVDRACPAGSACEPISNTENVCLNDCDAMTFCRKGYSCCGPGPRLKGWCSPPESPVCRLR